jgi:hypothetical protein
LSRVKKNAEAPSARRGATYCQARWPPPHSRLKSWWVQGLRGFTANLFETNYRLVQAEVVQAKGAFAKAQHKQFAVNCGKSWSQVKHPTRRLYRRRLGRQSTAAWRRPVFL